MTQPNQATIHDVGYKRYTGSRRKQSTRWRVIVKNFVVMAWPGYWRTKAWLFGALATTVALGAVLYILQGKTFSGLVSLVAGRDVSFADGIVPFGYRAFLYPMLAFILSMTAIAGTVARDLRAGAFEFYFARPVRPIDYVLGKLAGAAFYLSLILLVGPLLMALFRVGLSTDSNEFVAALPTVGKIAIIGVLATAAYAAVPLAISAFVARPGIALVIWATYYFVAGGIFQLLAFATKIPALAALDMKASVLGLSFGLFDIGLAGPRVVPPPIVSAGALVGFAVVGTAVLYWRVAKAQRDGLGGG